MHALGRIHAALVPGGALLDMRPAPEPPRVLVGGGPAGELDSTPFISDLHALDELVEQAVLARMFAVERETRFTVVYRFGSGRELVEEIAGWRRQSIPEHVRLAVEQGSPPYRVHEPCLLRRLVAL